MFSWHDLHTVRLAAPGYWAQCTCGWVSPPVAGAAAAVDAQADHQAAAQARQEELRLCADRAPVPIAVA